jgi:HSP20 family protein
MSLVNYEPWNLLDRFHQQLNHLSYSDKLLVAGDNDYSNVLTSRWHPPVDINEEKDRYLIIADIPGVDPKDIEITMENGALTVKGERHSETEDSNENYKRVERISGTFYRRFSLPDTADGDHIEAKGNNGVLEVTIPKHEKAQPRKIEVKS